MPRPVLGEPCTTSIKDFAIFPPPQEKINKKKLISCQTYFKRSESDYVKKNSHLAIDSKEFEFTNHSEIFYVQSPCQHALNKIPKSLQFPTRVLSIRVFEANLNSNKFAVTQATWNRPELLESRNQKILP